MRRNPANTRAHHQNNEAQRTKLRSEYRKLALPELLRTPKGIAALAEFIKDSGAFTFTREKYTPRDFSTFEEPELPDMDLEGDNSENSSPTSLMPH